MNPALRQHLAPLTSARGDRMRGVRDPMDPALLHRAAARDSPATDRSLDLAGLASGVGASFGLMGRRLDRGRGAAPRVKNPWKWRLFGLNLPRAGSLSEIAVHPEPRNTSAREHDGRGHGVLCGRLPIRSSGVEELVSNRRRDRRDSAGCPECGSWFSMSCRGRLANQSSLVDQRRRHQGWPDAVSPPGARLDAGQEGVDLPEGSPRVRMRILCLAQACSVGDLCRRTPEPCAGLLARPSV